MAAAFVSGAAFGGALTLAGVSDTTVITSQFRLQNFQMLDVFLGATAASALVAAPFVVPAGSTSSSSNKQHVFPRPPAGSLGLLSRWDANLVGGLLLGAGMALSGACPGTVLVQVATGTRSGPYALLGSVVGGIVWSGVLRPALAVRRRRRQSTTSSSSNSSNGFDKVKGDVQASGATPTKPADSSPAITVHEAIGWTRSRTVAWLEVLLIGAVAASSWLAPHRGTRGVVPPAVGGLLIGGAQLLSILLRNTMLGVSTAYEDMGDWFLWLLGRRGSGSSDGAARPRIANIVFAAGVLLGPWLLVRLRPGIALPRDAGAGPGAAVLGGLLAVLGSRLAGGCTSGHGISGISMLSLASLLTIGVAFAGGVALLNAVL